MRQELKGVSKVFKFTFIHHTGKKSYKTTLISVALLCLLIPALVMSGMEYFGGEGGGTPESGMPTDGMPSEGSMSSEQVEVDLSAVKKILVTEEFVQESQQTESGLQAAQCYTAASLEKFPFAEGGYDLEGVSFVEYGADFEAARRDAKGTDDTLILLIKQDGSAFCFNILTPEESGMDMDTASGVGMAMDLYGETVSGAVNAMAAADGADAGDGEGAGTDGGESDEPVSDMEGAKMVLGYLIPYLNIMVLYFFVLFYGQGVSQSVIMEKTSKLMDVFLISVRPAAMILGKVIAICLAGVIELMVWILCLIGGFALGRIAVLAINRESDMFLLELLDSFGSMTEGMFSVGGILVALMIMLAGMLMYCAIAGIGGALAGKPEDLSSTNVLFTLILIASFLANLLAGGLEGMDGGSALLDWIPFTSIMITPARVMLGSVSILKGLGCLAVVVATALLFTLLAGKLYKMMALYKGEVPGPKEMARMIREAK